VPEQLLLPDQAHLSLDLQRYNWPISNSQTLQPVDLQQYDRLIGDVH